VPGGVIAEVVPEGRLAGGEGNGEENHIKEKWKNDITFENKTKKMIL
jgi:hypothetical protein